MNFFKSILYHLISIFALASTEAHANERPWYETAGYSYSAVSEIGCNVMIGAHTKWFTVKEPYSMFGQSNTGRVWLEMTREQFDMITGGEDEGRKVIEQHILSSHDGEILSKSYHADLKVPFWVKAAAGLLSPAVFKSSVTIGVNLLDWLLRNGTDPTTAKEIAMLIRSGGKLEKELAIIKDEQKHFWLDQQIYFRTTVNDERRSYRVCSWTYPLSSIEPPAPPPPSNLEIIWVP